MGVALALKRRSPLVEWLGSPTSTTQMESYTSVKAVRRLTKLAEAKLDIRTRELYESALQLPESEREALIELLLPTIDHGDPNESDAMWRVEVARRAQEILSGAAEGIPWSEVKKEARRIARGKA